MRLRFRTVLVVAMLALLLGTVLVVGVTSFVSARDAAEGLAAQVLSHAAERAEDGAQHELDDAASEAALDASLFADGRVDPHDEDAVASYLLHALRAHPLLSSLSWAREDDGDLGVEVDHAIAKARSRSSFRRIARVRGHLLRHVTVDGKARHDTPSTTDDLEQDGRAERTALPSGGRRECPDVDRYVRLHWHRRKGERARPHACDAGARRRWKAPRGALRRF